MNGMWFFQIFLSKVGDFGFSLPLKMKTWFDYVRSNTYHEPKVSFKELGKTGITDHLQWNDEAETSEVIFDGFTL
jgi:hypothetical protein